MAAEEPDFDLETEAQRVRALAIQKVGAFYESLKQSPHIDWEAIDGLTEQGGTWVDGIATGVSYHDYVYLFLPGFASVKIEDARRLAVGAQLVAEHAILLDKLVDAQLGRARPSVLASYLSCHHRLQQAWRAFQQLFDAGSDFWPRFDAFWMEQAAVAVAERMRHERRVTPYDGAELWELAKGKQACAKLVPTALGLLGQEADKIEPLTGSQDHYAMGLQLYDDLRDWKVDYERGAYSYILTRSLIESGLAEEIAADARPDVELVGKHMYFSGLAEEVLAESIAAYERARELAADQGCPGWLAYVQHARSLAENLQRDISLIRSSALARARIEAEDAAADLAGPEGVEAIPERVREAAESALRFLLEQQQDGFPEARHAVIFPRHDGLSEGGEVHWGDVMPRAVVLEALAGCRDAGLNVSDDVLQAEVDYLVQSRREGAQAGWTYIPGVSGLPADADTLGTVLCALAVAAPDRLGEVCGDLAALLVAHNVRPSGAVDTWLADPADEDAARAKAHMHSGWGEEPDVDVAANALFGLSSYDTEAFADVLEPGASYIAAAQQDDGSWSGHWHWGRTYPTWLCCRLLAHVEPNCEALARGLQFVSDAQLEDGGWGEMEGTPLESAFGVLACCLKRGPTDLDQTARSGLSYLLTHQRRSGAWPAGPFVKVDLSRFRPEQHEPSSARVFTFKSATLTTAFCLRALLTALQES